MARYQFSGRTEQTKAVVARWRDAKALHQERRWRGAMYMAGYVIECKLKASLMEQFGVNTLHALQVCLAQRQGVPVAVFSHNIEVLFELTGARGRLVASADNQSALRAFQACNAWRPAWRYRPGDGRKDECEAFMASVQVFRDFLENNT